MDDVNLSFFCWRRSNPYRVGWYLFWQLGCAGGDFSCEKLLGGGWGGRLGKEAGKEAGEKAEEETAACLVASGRPANCRMRPLICGLKL